MPAGDLMGLSLPLLNLGVAPLFLIEWVNTPARSSTDDVLRPVGSRHLCYLRKGRRINVLETLGAFCPGTNSRVDGSPM